MPITVKVYANADDVMIAWRPDKWVKKWVGFKLERRNEQTGSVTVIANRIPPKPEDGPPPRGGFPSDRSPIRRCLWTDHSVAEADKVAYRVTAMVAEGDGFKADKNSTSDWTPAVVASGDAGDGLSAYFNRGTIMSQIVSRFVGGNITEPVLKQFVTDLARPGFPARRYLSGDARHQVLTFLSNADRRGSEIYLALYEINDHELVDALKPFGERGHILIGNGGATQSFVAEELTAAGFEVRHRDLSHRGDSSPSVHNKFAVETGPGGADARAVLTGSLNWTVTGLCTQINNVILIERPEIAQAFAEQWQTLVGAGDDMPDTLRHSNSTVRTDPKGDISLWFAATENEDEFEPILKLIGKAKSGIVFTMFTPGQSPLLSALLDRAKVNDIYVRGVVSQVRASKTGDIVAVQGQVVKSGTGLSPSAFHEDVHLPAGVPANNRPNWAESEFNIKQMLDAGMIAIVHSKTIVIDPFSKKDCVVITGSHNFSDSASKNNDENLVIIRGNTALAQAYALHINGVYDHYSWRNYLKNHGDPKTLYAPLDGWHKKGSNRTQELGFWTSD